MGNLSTDPLDRRLREVDPLRWLSQDREVDDLMRALSSDVIAAAPNGPRSLGIVARRKARRRRTLWAPLGVGVLALTTAAGVMQWYDTASPDFGAALDSYSSELPLPPGTDRSAYVAYVQGQGKGQPTSMSDSGVESMVSYYGVCTWLAAWDHRHGVADTTGAVAAVKALRQAVDAPALSRDDGGGVVANLRRVADAAAAGDGVVVTTELTANCAGLPLSGIR